MTQQRAPSVAGVDQLVPICVTSAGVGEQKPIALQVDSSMRRSSGLTTPCNCNNDDLDIILSKSSRMYDYNDPVYDNLYSIVFSGRHESYSQHQTV